MFFIGIFGVENKIKNISGQNAICPLCNAYGHYDILKAYNFFHLFFIPLWQWNKRYFIKTACCGKFCALDYDIGNRIENGEAVEIKREDISCDQFYNNLKYCPRCSLQIDPSFHYCPYCGNRV